MKYHGNLPDLLRSSSQFSTRDDEVDMLEKEEVNAEVKRLRADLSVMMVGIEVSRKQSHCYVLLKV